MGDMHWSLDGNSFLFRALNGLTSSCGTYIQAPRPNFSFPFPSIALSFYFSPDYKWLILKNPDNVRGTVISPPGLVLPNNYLLNEWANQPYGKTRIPVLQKESWGSVLAKMTLAVSCTVRMQTQISDSRFHWDL